MPASRPSVNLKGAGMGLRLIKLRQLRYQTPSPHIDLTISASAI